MDYLADAGLRRAVHEEFESRIKPGERDAVVKHRRELDAILRDAMAMFERAIKAR